MGYSTIFLTVLGTLLAGGSLYFLVQGLVHRSLRRQYRKLDLIYDLAENVMGSEDAPSILDQAVEIAPGLAEATHCSIWILDPVQQKFVCQAATDSHEAVVSLHEMSGVVTCYRKRATTEVPDAENCPFVAQEAVRRVGQKALLYLPIEVEGECLGVIEVEDRRRKRVFSESVTGRLEHLARLVGLSLRQRVQASLTADLHRSEKIGAIGELVEGLSEEMISPLGRIVGLAEPSLDTSEPRLLTARLNAVGQEAQRALEILTRVVKLVRSRSQQTSELDLIELVEGVAATQKQRWKRRGLDLRLKLSKSESTVIGDEGQLEEAFRNIFLNAERMLEERGLRAMEVYSHVLDRSVLISMTPADLKHVSDLPNEQESFVGERRSDGPSAIGLAVCQILIEKAGASMRIRNGHDAGFSIEIEYPVAQPGDIEESGAASESRSAPKSLMALVIDNDVDTQDGLLYHLADRGHRVIPVSSLEEGLDLCERIRFDWVFCNVQMGRKSGLDVYRLFQGRVHRFVFLVDARMVIYNQELFAGQDRAVLRKPFKGADIDKLLEPSEGSELVFGESTATKA
ncbi:MAG: GAF domain-containing protein [Acidobacteria bacterium]|nr:GAF domain-containing protein [Acidobacteriota bacterium]